MSEHFFGPPMEKLLKLVGEILVEVKEMRREYAEGQAVISTSVYSTTRLPDRLEGAAFNHSYER